MIRNSYKPFSQRNNRIGAFDAVGATGVTAVDAWLGLPGGTNNEFKEDTFAIGNATDVLLFGPDAPAIVQATSRYIGSSGGVVFFGSTTIGVNLEAFENITRIDSVNNAGIVVDEAPLAAGGRTVCTVNGVPNVVGTLLSLSVADRKYQNSTTDGDTISPQVRITALSNSGAVIGEPWLQDEFNGDLPSGAIILKASSYTQAVRDAGNIIFGGKDGEQRMLVVGVYTKDE